MGHSFGCLQTLKRLVDYGNKVTDDNDASRVATIKAVCFLCPAWDMPNGGGRESFGKFLDIKKMLNFYSEKRIEDSYLMEMTAKWEDIEDYSYHFDFDKTNSNHRVFAPLRTFITMHAAMEDV
jgi:hypothetical protein